MTSTALDLPPVRPSTRTELRAAAREVATLFATGLQTLRRPATWSAWHLTVVLVWLVGTAGDAYTTLAMMSTGQFEEANGIAAAGMGVVGPAGYTAAASAVSVALAVANVGRRSGLYSTVIVAALSVVGLLKVYTAASNLLLWVTT